MRMTLVEQPVIVPGEPAPAVRNRVRCRVLISAFAVSPVQGSENVIGWQLPLHLAAYHDVTLLTTPHVSGANMRGEIEEYLQRHGSIDGLRFHFVEPPPLSKFLQQDNQNSS